MPGPQSAPNGDRQLVSNPLVDVRHEDGRIEHVRLREKLRRRNKLATGKTENKRKR